MASVTPIQPTEIASEAREDAGGIAPPGVSDTTAWNLCTPAPAEYRTVHRVPDEQDPTRVRAVVSKIWIALPSGHTFADAVAVRMTLAPETAAGALAARVRLGGGAARIVATGTLGWTDGLPAGAPSDVDDGTGSLHAAGVLSGELAGHGVRPSGVEALPGVTSALSLFRQDAPTPDAGQGWDPSGRLTWRASVASAEHAAAAQRAAVDARTVVVPPPGCARATATATARRALVRSECTDTPVALAPWRRQMSGASYPALTSAPKAGGLNRLKACQ
ncbi:MAG TPA: hypothetical protein VGT01_11200 [Candidatus Dormibacteraeota bacterium]|nr:hypothetical protein [Candidatus Dormibacteraeota bacterium]